MRNYFLLTIIAGCVFTGCRLEKEEAETASSSSKAETLEAEVPDTADPLPESKIAKPKPAKPESKPSATSDPEQVAILEPEKIPTLLSSEEIAAGWISLFDGYSLFGWETEFADRWEIADNTLSSANDIAPSILLTTIPWSDYELSLDYKLEAGGNSGLFLRSTAPPTDPSADCYELNLCDTHEKFKTGSIVTRAQPIAMVNGDGGWHTVRVLAEDNWIQAWLDDVHMTDFRDESDAPLLSGRIGLQQNGGTVSFRNVKLRPLGMRNLFDGETLSGWRVIPGSKSEFAVEENAIHVENGAGFLETEQAYQDFVLQADYRINGDGLNSGIFFRALPGTEETPSHGYEFQIHNAFENGDPRQPVDHGSGAIFRRVKARRVVSQDREWNTVTLNAVGNHFATWVNGYQTVDWTDTREPDENPRKGRKDAAGHLSLQGHDPTTDLDYRKLKISNVP